MMDRNELNYFQIYSPSNLKPKVFTTSIETERGNGGHLVNIRFNNVLIYIIVTWHRIKQCTVKIMKVLRIKLT